MASVFGDFKGMKISGGNNRGNNSFFNLSSTQLKYDIVASKFMTGIHNHHKRNAPVLFLIKFNDFVKYV